MTAFYLDTSALVKRYAAEVGTAWVTRLDDPGAGNDVYLSLLTGAEMMSALTRKARTGEMTPAAAAGAIGNFKADWANQYQLLDVSLVVANQAMLLAEQYGLRGYDAVHLATAIELQTTRRLMRHPLTFISADTNQVQAASAEGLATDNPNLHP